MILGVSVGVEADPGLRGDDRRAAELRELVALLGHELRTPLGSLSTALEALDVDAADRETRRRMLMIVRRQVGQLSRLVDDLLDSATSPSRLAVHRERIDLVSLVRDLTESQRPVLGAAGLRLVVELPERELPVEGDSLRLGQVFDNLLGNALKFTPSGGQVRVGLEDCGDGAVRVVVADTGDGIDGGDLTSIFEPFRRGENRNTAGLGLGLAIVRRLVEAHGGTVEARSDGPGCGAAFLVRLPLAGAQSVASTP